MANPPCNIDTAPCPALHFLVVGGGLGGLTAALSLRRAGQRVTIFEQSRFASETGAAINVPPNATGLLLHLGVDLSTSGAVELQQITGYDKDGNAVNNINILAVDKSWQHKYLLAHRVDLHSQLKDAATSANGVGIPVVLKPASRVSKLDPHRTTITLDDDTVVTGDAIIGADGIHSTTRGILTSTRPQPSGKSAYRFLVSRDAILQLPNARAVLAKDGELVFWMAADRRIVMYPTRNNSLWNFVCILPDPTWDGADDSWNRSGSREDLLKAFEGFEERALTLLRMADPATLKVWRLMDMGAIDDWQTGNFCLLGDAAHPFLPHQGQGAAQAMEDAVSLGVLFPFGVERSEVPARLKLYQRCRKDRAEVVQELTRQSGADIDPSESGGMRLDHITEFIRINCNYDELASSAQRLRLWEHTERSRRYWRMPVSFGPSPGPRQSLGPWTWRNSKSTFISRTIKFKTSRASLSTLLPTPAFSIPSSDSFACASYVHTSLDKLDWLAGKGYDYIGFFIHGVQFVKKDGSAVSGTFLAVMLENLAEPILTGREELGFPKLFSEINTQQSLTSYQAQASWRESVFLKLELDGLRDGEQPRAADDSRLLLYKYIPATGEPGVADVEYPVCAPQHLCPGNFDRFQTATKARIMVEERDERALPSLHHVACGLAKIPVYNIVEASIVEGSCVDNFSGAYRIELKIVI
ncbi:hypothetical protein LMH87_000174 [Akanthomyces muscarius]|uniref:FAD-binding domain-containing protein n=1 Tax=Akanthomyces muscarius TaxID=2231603 RepID=A0A9W8QES5_AKAMU|nr:hypothetical protein LMH87_000174 [Akanthomyces muscarius]KAJ4154901.1 hypothetical protein LMH87_000174 [Akanthomyces muscarius]